MANGDDMRILMEELLPCVYFSLGSDAVDIVTPDLSVPYMTKELFENLQNTLFKKLVLIHGRWNDYFAISLLKALSSHEMYLRYVMFACEIESGLSEDIFDNLLNVFALVIAFILETHQTTCVNFCDLTVDIFMEFYERTLKDPFRWFGGFERFAEYLRKESIAEEDNLSDDSEVPVTYRASLKKNPNNILEEVFEKAHLQPEYITHEDVIGNIDCHILATEVLFNTKIKLPTLPSSDELMVRIRTYRHWKAAVSEHQKTRTESKRKAMKTNSKREEVLLTANITLPPAPNVTTRVWVDEVAARVCGGEATSAGDSRDETTARDPRDETTAARDPRDETTAARDPRDETTATRDPRDETTKTTARNPRGKTTMAARAPRGETTARDSRGETTKRVLHRISNTQAFDVVEQKANIAWCENIIQQVIKYNKSNCSYPTEENKRIQEEACETLEHMKDTIKCLIEILDKYDEE